MEDRGWGGVEGCETERQDTQWGGVVEGGLGCRGKSDVRSTHEELMRKGVELILVRFEMLLSMVDVVVVVVVD